MANYTLTPKSTLQNSQGNKNEVLSKILHEYIEMNNRLYSQLYLYLKNVIKLKKILHTC